MERAATVARRPLPYEAVLTPEQVAEARWALGRALAEARAAARITQGALADRLCYSRSTIANVETGRQNVSRAFWKRADLALSARGTLLTAFDEVDALVRCCQAQAEATRNQQRLARWLSAQSQRTGNLVLVVLPADGLAEWLGRHGMKMGD